jgi:1-deoxy-D-xylulose-5-phosphate synthase
VHPALDAATELAADGISAAVLNARFVKPLDTKRIVALAQKCRALITLEEHCEMGGFGSAVLEALSDAGIDKPTHCMAVADALIEQGQTRESCGLGTADITATVERLLGTRSSGD